MKSVILANRDTCRIVEEEAKYEFTIHILESMGIPEDVLEECFPEGGFNDFSVNHKIKLRDILRKFDITILGNGDGGFKIYVDKEVVAEWKKSIYYLKKDMSKLKPSDQLYVEVHVEYWTIFEEE